MRAAWAERLAVLGHQDHSVLCRQLVCECVCVCMYVLSSNPNVLVYSLYLFSLMQWANLITEMLLVL